jgi:hypothetical protein
MRARDCLAGCGLVAVLAGGARAEDRRDGDADFFAGFPAIRVGLGGGGGTACGAEQCRDGYAVSGAGGVGPRSGAGAWVDFAVHFAARDVCAGLGCGELPTTFALTGGIGQRTGRWYGGAGLGVAYTGAAFDPLWKYAHAAQTSAVAGVAVLRGGDFELSIEARAMMSLAPFGDLRTAGVAVVVGNR